MRAFISTRMEEERIEDPIFMRYYIDDKVIMQDRDGHTYAAERPITAYYHGFVEESGPDLITKLTEEDKSLLDQTIEKEKEFNGFLNIITYGEPVLFCFSIHPSTVFSVPKEDFEYMTAHKELFEELENIEATRYAYDPILIEVDPEDGQLMILE